MATYSSWHIFDVREINKNAHNSQAMWNQKRSRSNTCFKYSFNETNLNIKNCFACSCWLTSSFRYQIFGLVALKKAIENLAAKGREDNVTAGKFFHQYENNFKEKKTDYN